MPTSECHICGGTVHWRWEEAFDKFGFGDGDGQVETANVEAVLEEAGYEVASHQWGMHNTIIVSIKKGGVEFVDKDDVTPGYDDPRDYLPPEIVELLDRELPGEDVDTEVAP